MICVLGCDIGTTSTKSIVMDVETGDVVASARSFEYGPDSPKPKWSEQNADVWMRACFESIRKAVSLAATRGVPVDEISAVCISSLNPGSGIPLDSELTPIYPALIYNDSRAVKEAKDALRIVGQDKLSSVTGNTSDSYFGFTKILWIKNNLPKIWEDTFKFVTPNGYAAYLLTGILLYDVCYAGNLGGFFDVNRSRWSDELLNDMDVPRDKLPDLIPCDQIVGEVTPKGSELSGLKTGTPVAAGGDDAPTSALGSGALDDGDHNFMCGTSGCWNIIQDERIRPWRITTKLINFPFVVDSDHKLESFGGSKTTGHCFKWFANLTGTNEQTLDREAESSLAAERGLSFVPQMMGERTPDWNPSRFGSFNGLSGMPNRGELYRAIVEGVAFDLLRHADPIAMAEIKISKSMLISGSTAKSQVYRRILADVTGYRVMYAPRSCEAPGGDALIAALASNQVSDAKVIRKWLKLDSAVVTEPDEKAHSRYVEYFRKVWSPNYVAGKDLDDTITSWAFT
ncbi:MAG TPA: FGGY family carbohydrate kinase [Terriglobales bacterium]|nr:FGGY family carbohydrate kinase [Terriglobales bacterium]